MCKQFNKVFLLPVPSTFEQCRVPVARKLLNHWDNKGATGTQHLFKGAGYTGSKKKWLELELTEQLVLYPRFSVRECLIKAQF